MAPKLRQVTKVWAVMCDRRWRTLLEVSAFVGGPPSSISARLRELNLTLGVERRSVRPLGGGRPVYQYRLRS